MRWLTGLLILTVWITGCDDGDQSTPTDMGKALVDSGMDTGIELDISVELDARVDPDTRFDLDSGVEPDTRVDPDARPRPDMGPTPDARLDPVDFEILIAPDVGVPSEDCPPGINATRDGACITSIYQTRDRTLFERGVKVQIQGQLTAVGLNGQEELAYLVLQTRQTDPVWQGPDNGAIWVYASDSEIDLGELMIGDEFRVTAHTHSFAEQTQLNRIEGIEVVEQGVPLPEPMLIPAQDILFGAPRAEPLDGFLVRIEDLNVIGIDREAREFFIENGPRVDDYFFRLLPFPYEGSVFNSIAGILRMDQGEVKLEPRDASDIERGEPQIAVFGPRGTFLRAGQEQVPTNADGVSLTIILDQRAQNPIELQAESNHPDVMVNPVVIPAGEQRATVSLFAAEAVDEVTITLTYQGRSLSAQVRVFEAVEPPDEVVLLGGDIALFNSEYHLRVRVNRPAINPILFNIVVDPPESLIGPISTLIQSDQRDSLDMVFEVSNQEAEVTITALSEDGELVAEHHVRLTETPPVSPLLINEIDVSGRGFDFVELLSNSERLIALRGYRLELVDAEGMIYETIELQDLGGLPARGYAVIGTARVLARLPEGVPTLLIPEGTLQAGIAGMRLVLIPRDLRVDSISYGGVPVMGATESRPFLGNPPDGSGPPTISRCPNGEDTNNNFMDFANSLATPGVANRCP